MKVQTVSLFLFFLFVSIVLFGQTDSLKRHNNSVYIELGGIGGYGSLNYERTIYEKEKLKLGGRVGISTYRITDYTRSFNPDIIIPFGINFYYGKKHHGIFGIGQAISSTISASDSDFMPERNTSLNANFTIGYGFQKSKKGMMYRISYSPIIENYKYYKHWFAVAIGYVF